MATIQNERDKILQAAAVRFVLPTIDPGQIPGLEDAMNATKGIAVHAPGAVFQIGMGGVATPASIKLTASLTNVTGSVTWSVSNGTAIGYSRYRNSKTRIY